MGIDEFYKCNMREELLALLNRHREEFAHSILDYLNSLIELEFSVIREYISDDAREMLSELEIYKKIATYNIYFRALDIFEQNKHNLSIISAKSYDLERLRVSTQLGNIKLFDFNHEEGIIDSDLNVPSDDKKIEIGTISLYQVVENKELREAELYWISEKIKQLTSIDNPFRGGDGPFLQWENRHQKEIDEWKYRLRDLEKITSIAEEEVEVSNRIHSLLLEDYGLTDQSFKEETRIYQPKSGYQKILIKSQPNLIITNHVKSI